MRPFQEVVQARLDRLIEMLYGVDASSYRHDDATRRVFEAAASLVGCSPTALECLQALARQTPLITSGISLWAVTRRNPRWPGEPQMPVTPVIEDLCANLANPQPLIDFGPFFSSWDILFSLDDSGEDDTDRWIGHFLGQLPDTWQKPDVKQRLVSGIAMASIMGTHRMHSLFFQLVKQTENRRHALDNAVNLALAPTQGGVN